MVIQLFVEEFLVVVLFLFIYIEICAVKVKQAVTQFVAGESSYSQNTLIPFKEFKFGALADRCFGLDLLLSTLFIFSTLSFIIVLLDFELINMKVG